MNEGSQPPTGAYEPFPPFAHWTPKFDPATSDQFASLLQDDKDSLDDDALKAAVRIATRYAAIDTGAIEGLYSVDRGFTKTIATEAAAWESALKAHGDNVAQSIDDALKAFEFVLDAVTGAQQISESWIRQLHQISTASQDFYTVYTAVGPQRQPLPKGVYKSMPNSPTSVSTGRVHHYAPPSDTPSEMARLLDELRAPQFASAHPILQAAYAHYAFVCIHPFADGNGRVSRLLASVFLYRSPGVPLVIFADQKDLYIDALEAADGGNPSPFVSFIEQRCIDTIEIVRLHLRTAESPAPNASLEALVRDLSGRGGLAHTEFDATASRLRDLVREEFNRVGRELPLPLHTQFVADNSRSSARPPEGFRPAAGGLLGIEATLTTSNTITVNHVQHFFVWPARQDGLGSDFCVTTHDGSHRLDVYIRDVHPAETEVLRLKISGWVDNQVSIMVAEFSHAVRTELSRHGYTAPP